MMMRLLLSLIPLRRLEPAEKKQQAASGGAGRRAGGTGDIGAGEAEGSQFADAAMEHGINRQQRQQTQEPRILELEITGHRPCSCSRPTRWTLDCGAWV